jgi:hypothetical protein
MPRRDGPAVNLSLTMASHYRAHGMVGIRRRADQREQPSQVRREPDVAEKA